MQRETAWVACSGVGGVLRVDLACAGRRVHLTRQDAAPAPMFIALR